MSGEPTDRRQKILERDSFRCAYCGQTFADPDLTLDHVEPRMRGGDHSDGNLVACCRSCNTAKAGLPAWRYLASRASERANFLAYATAVWPRLRRAVEQAARD